MTRWLGRFTPAAQVEPYPACRIPAGFEAPAPAEGKKKELTEVLVSVEYKLN